MEDIDFGMFIVSLFNETLWMKLKKDLFKNCNELVVSQ